ncbi:unnamed protein product [Paramecium pentaurelia]|uniref:Uncharacterized protein n=1 Tax=Paramecium pentaurelia TaxID=43138 RepID=A0A8S1USH5_9CILI|nr:unnamed protein product [Paramecium pentaurelia]
MKLLGSNNQFIKYIEKSENGFYSIEIQEDPSYFIDYIIFIQTKEKGFVATPSQINLKFHSKSFDEASSFCNKQLNFSIKRVPMEEPKGQQQQQQQQINRKRKRGLLIVLQEISYYLEQYQGRFLSFQNYFEFETNEAKIQKYNWLLRKQKKKEKVPLSNQISNKVYQRQNYQLNKQLLIQQYLPQRKKHHQKSKIRDFKYLLHYLFLDQFWLCLIMIKYLKKMILYHSTNR